MGYVLVKIKKLRPVTCIYQFDQRQNEAKFQLLRFFFLFFLQRHNRVLVSVLV